MTSVVASIPKFQFSNASGLPMVGGTLTSYLAGTTTPAATYQDEALTSTNTNPISLDSRGECTLWLDSTKVYKFVLKNAAGVTQWTVDNVTNSTAFAKAYADSLDVALRADLAAPSGASLIGYLNDSTDAVATTLEEKLQESVSVMDFGAVRDGVTDDTAAFQRAINSLKTVIVPEGSYAITTVSVSMQGCEIIMHEKAYLIVNGAGIQRNITQVTRATYMASNSMIDGYNWYDTVKVSGGNIVLAANSIGVSDRIPFLQYIGAPPTPANPLGLQPFKTPMHVSGTTFIMEASTSIGVAIHGGWGTIIEDCSFTGFDCGKGIYINGDGTYNTSSHPQLITIQDCTFNSCTPIDAVKGTCTNSCEALNLFGNKFNFVQAITLNTVNGLKIIGNDIIFNEQSMRIVDCGTITISENYLQVAQQHVSSAHSCVVSFVNSARVVVNNNNVVINNAANNRSGFGFYTNTVNDYYDIEVSDIMFTKALTGGSAIAFAASTAPYTFENIIISNIIAPYFSYVVNFFDVVGGSAKNVSVNELTTRIGDGSINAIVGYSRLDLASFNAPEYYQKIKLDVATIADASGSAGECFAYSVPTTVRKTTFSVVVTNFVNTGNCVNLTATNTSGSIRILIAQATALPVGTPVSGTADLEIFGDIS